jgi:hydroxypyruvate isomerase
MPKFSANLSFLFTELPFLDRFAAAAGAGFKAVEYMSPYEHDPLEIARRHADNGLTQALFNLPVGDWEAGDRGLAILATRRREFHDGLTKALDYANALQCERLNCLAGIALAGSDRLALEAAFVDNLAFAAETASKRGVKLLIEPVNDRDIPGFFLNRTDEALRLTDA